MHSSPEAPPIIFGEDDHHREHYFSKTRWVAVLSDGRRVYEDYNRPEYQDSAWLRLGRFIRQSGLGIAEVYLQFRSHEEHPLPKNARGYFLRKSIIQFFGQAPVDFYLLGYLDDHNRVQLARWQAPELIQIESETRDPADEELVGLSLILNPVAHA